jgi:hypothetical protein
MRRWWLLNPYPPADGEDRRAWWRKHLPSVRVHHILRPDTDRHLHDHPWHARTVILDGWYEEERLGNPAAPLPRDFCGMRRMQDGTVRDRLHRNEGYTGELRFGEYHRISRVSLGGVVTLFITWRKQGTWGFEVDGRKVPWSEYLKEHG